MGPDGTGPILQMQTFNERPIDPNHVRSLETSFENDGMLNRLAKNAITILAPWSAFQPHTLSSKPSKVQAAEFKADADLFSITVVNGQHRIHVVRTLYENLAEGIQKQRELLEELEAHSPDVDLITSATTQITEAEAKVEGLWWLVRIVDKGT